MRVNEWIKKAIPLMLGLSFILIVPTFADAKVLDSGMVVVDGSATENLFLKEESEGFILFSNNDWLYGYLDLEGNVVIPAKFESAELFHSGMARVKTDDGVAFIDKTGEIQFYTSTIEEQFDAYVDINNFSGDRALVEVG